jgi:Protein NO VEIN, C-terminal
LIESESCFRMSVLNGLDRLLTAINEYPGVELPRLSAALHAGSGCEAGFDYDTAVSILDAMPDIRRVSTEAREPRLQSLLCHLLTRLRPSWRRLVPRGRTYLLDYLDEDARSAFEIAGLYGEPNATVRRWWDHVSALIRGSGEEERIETGRRVEELTLRYERGRLSALGRSDLVPVWVGFEDNSLGYDVRSYTINEDGRVLPRYIEVKATAADPARFYLTRNEWRVALRHPDDYLVYVWQLTNGQLAEISVRQLSLHVPEDRGDGRWDVSIIVWDP